jgi:hypothetical protein
MTVAEEFRSIWPTAVDTWKRKITAIAEVRQDMKLDPYNPGRQDGLDVFGLCRTSRRFGTRREGLDRTLEPLFGGHHARSNTATSMMHSFCILLFQRNSGWRSPSRPCRCETAKVADSGKGGDESEFPRPPQGQQRQIKKRTAD